MTSDLFAPWPDPRNYEELAEAVKEEPQYCVAAVWQRQFLRHLIDSCSNELGDYVIDVIMPNWVPACMSYDEGSE